MRRNQNLRDNLACKRAAPLRSCLLDVLSVEVLDVLEAQQRKESPAFSVLLLAVLEPRTKN
jgi:hypothetical protein